MTEQALGPAPKKARYGLGGLVPRIDRKVYCAVVLLLFAIGAVCGLLHIKVGSATTIPLAMVMLRRLHDFNRSGWWVVAILGGPALLMVALAPIAPPTVTAPFVGLLSLVWIVWLGTVPSDPFENRFGPPMGGSPFKDVFS